MFSKALTVIVCVLLSSRLPLSGAVDPDIFDGRRNSNSASGSMSQESTAGQMSQSTADSSAGALATASQANGNQQQGSFSAQQSNGTGAMPTSSSSQSGQRGQRSFEEFGFGGTAAQTETVTVNRSKQTYDEVVSSAPVAGYPSEVPPYPGYKGSGPIIDATNAPGSQSRAQQNSQRSSGQTRSSGSGSSDSGSQVPVGL